MIDGFRIIAVVPSGRRQYLAILKTYLDKLKGVIDECHLWVNTVDEDDLVYIHSMVESDKKYYFVEELENPRPDWRGNQRVRLLREFYPICCNQNTVYIRFDDDICWIETSAVADLVRFRIQNPQYLLVYPAIINNGRTSYLHQIMGVSPLPDNTWPGERFDKYNLTKMPPIHGEIAHINFMDKLASGNTDALKFGLYVSRNYERIPINCILWLGSDFAKFNGDVASSGCDLQEEVWLTEIATKSFGRMNAIYGECLVSHFSFNTQKQYLEETNLLGYYEQIALADGEWPFTESVCGY